MTDTSSDGPSADRPTVFTTDEQEDGGRLDTTVAGRMDISRSAVQRLIADGLVTVDGEVLAKSTSLTVGQTISVTPAVEPVPEPPPVIDIRYVDDHIAIVSKPADLVVHDGAGVRGATLVDALLAQGLPLAPADDPTRPGIVHRLDRGTSGLLVVALSQPALERLKDVFAAHDVEREYWALVEGEPDPPMATIDAPIVRSTSNRTTFTTGDGGRRAITHYDTLAVHRATSELSVRLETGRTHQVRVHLRAIGRPVAGDRSYGADADMTARLGLRRQALHAARLAFAHPVDGTRVEVVEPLPEDLAAAQRIAAG